jgi:hypothetical protein
MQDYERLGVFYLGKSYDLEARQATEELLLYDSKDLMTHAMVVGMTGSGKTGLCIGLIEEAAIDGVPSILIDPKGDLANLLLTFPDLGGEDFLPWVNLDEARQKGLAPEAYAEQQAQLWQKGLAGSGQSGERIRRLRDSAEFRIYTPASSAGFPVSILKSFAAPGPETLEDAELMRDRVGTTVTSLLGLVGIEADPVQSREYILLSTIIDTVWRSGEDLDLAQLITLVQQPPVTKIGVLELESFYPSKDRFALVMALNNLLASPGFHAWLEGEPLDIGQILYSPTGKPRVAIFSVAHLGDTERMFFVSLLLNQVLGWVRTQPGTTSLRAILYMDEIFGYLPPVGNPPSKRPMLTLLKQARAYGLGVVLATQNPVDLDYKALSNMGTWWIGRLQTERDKLRVLDGLEGAATAAGAAFDRQALDRILSGLGSRVFLMNNTHEDAPVVMTTRWALSYLRGPLTREQIRTLMAPGKAAAPVSNGTAAGAPASAAIASAAIASAVTASAAPASAAPASAAPASAATASAAPASAAVPAAQAATAPPALPPEIPQYYLPVRGRAPAGLALEYLPFVLGAARVAFTDTKTRVNSVQPRQFLTAISDGVIPVDWDAAQASDLEIAGLEKRPAQGARFAPLPPAAGKAKSYTAWEREFANWLYGSQGLELLRSPSQKIVSNPGEDERDFRLRLSQSAREQRDAAVEALRKKYAPKIATLQERLRRAEQAVEREKEQSRQQGLQAAISIGATILGAFTGRKTGSRANIGRATTAARGVSRSMNERGDVQRAQESMEAVAQNLKELQAEFDAEAAEVAARVDPTIETLETVVIKLRKADINVQLVALAWAPHWVDEQGSAEPAF